MLSVRGKEKSFIMWNIANVSSTWNSKSCRNVEKPYSNCMWNPSNLLRTRKLSYSIRMWKISYFIRMWNFSDDYKAPNYVLLCYLDTWVLSIFACRMGQRIVRVVAGFFGGERNSLSYPFLSLFCPVLGGEGVFCNNIKYFLCQKSKWF